MPTYDYECQACEHAFERFQSITAKPVRMCPECRARRVKRLIGAGAAVIFKGSGFYQTDYRSAEYKRRKSEDKPSSDSKSDSKSGSTSASSGSGDTKSTTDGGG